MSCLERAAGNPLFLEQLLRNAEEHADGAVPDSVQSLVQARIDRLKPPDKQALQAASVFGQRFALGGLRALIEDPNYLPQVLVEHALLRPHGDEFLFGHALIRDAVYATLLRSRRRELHKQAAVWFAARDLGLYAQHLDRAGDPRAPQAYLAAARSEAVRYRYEQALALLDRGASLARDPQDQFALACYRGELLHDVGEIADARAAYEEALQQSQNDADRCRAWLGIAAVGCRSKALAAIHEALAISAETGMAYFGPVYYGMFALIEEDQTRRRAALSDGEALLSGNVVAHNHLLFRRDAIEASMLLHDWHETERHAAALEDFVRPEPLPWTGFIIARARAFSAFGKGRRNAELKSELQRLQIEGNRLGICLPGVLEIIGSTTG